MTEVVLYHHVQGLTEGVRRSPTSYGRRATPCTRRTCSTGRRSTLEEGMAFARETGFEALGERGVAAAEGIGPDVVYAGFSFGAMRPSSWRRPAPAPAVPCSVLLPAGLGVRGARGPRTSRCRSTAWMATRSSPRRATPRPGVAASTDRRELFLYPGEEHLFTDSSLPAYDPAPRPCSSSARSHSSRNKPVSVT